MLINGSTGTSWQIHKSEHYLKMGPFDISGNNDACVDCSGWYTTYDHEAHSFDDSEMNLERERRALEEERRLEVLYARLDHRKVSR